MKLLEKSVRESLEFRFACRLFDKDRSISDADFSAILHSALLTPSSFGLQPVRIMVIDTPSLREQVKQFCWNQAQITECSKLLILKTLTQDLIPPSDYIRKIYAQREKAGTANAKGGYDGFLEKFSNFLKNNEKLGISVANWATKQAYLTAQSIMLQAASLGIDSCPIEGFDKTPLEELLNLNREKEQVALVITLGYRAGVQNPRVRLDLKELVEYR